MKKKATIYSKIQLLKLLRLFRLITLFLALGISHVSGITYRQRVTIVKKAVTIEEVFKVIKRQTGFDIIWSDQQFNDKKYINVDFQMTPLTKVMSVCIAGQDVNFVQQDNAIIISKNSHFENLLSSRQDTLLYRGSVYTEDGKPLVGATVKSKDGFITTKTNDRGNFQIRCSKKNNLIFSFLGYISKEMTLTKLNSNNEIKVVLVAGTNNLIEVSVVSTGYQDLPKERATGSFETITKEQLQHSSDPDLIRRLEGITTSMDFNNQRQSSNSARGTNSAIANVTIRGKNTLNPVNFSDNTSGQVLVVIDGIASPYSIDKVNPNDVESVTILKDAASSSIWGSRAANGVIVIKTKRGLYDHPLSLSFNSNVNISKKLNLFYKNYMSVSDFIDAQIFQFNISKTVLEDPSLDFTQPLASPVTEILNNRNQGLITENEATEQINSLRKNNIRNDYSKYILRDAVTQSYSLGLDGGSKKVAYRLSAAYDKMINNTINSDQDRLVLNYSTSISLLKNLEFTGSITYNQQRTHDQADQNRISASIDNVFFPYTRLADENGNHLTVPLMYRPSFIELLKANFGDNILGMNYVPLDDINEGYTKTNSQGVNLNMAINYRLNSVFSTSIQYNYNLGYDKTDVLYGKDSFYMRNLINYYTDPVTFTKNIPVGGLYLPTNNNSSNQTIRGQLNIEKNWNAKNVISAIAGIDIGQNYFKMYQQQYYGYSDRTLKSNNQLDYVNYVNTLFGDSYGFTDARIPYLALGLIDQRIRTYSIFSNAAYTYNRKYTLSASIRKDQSSEFGKGTNKGGTPFYSVGSSWNIANENFYHIDWLPSLRLRGTFGYNGNVNPQVSARPLITYSTDKNTSGLYDISFIQNVTNLKLRPEKTRIINLGLDYGLKNGVLSGSLEFYDKKTTDLLSSAPVDPSTGYSNLTINTATLHGWGSDLTLNSRNLQIGAFNWVTNFLMSYNRVKVVKLFSNSATTAAQVVAGSPNYNEGFDLSRLFGYRWAGLDPQTGDPRGYLNGVPMTITSDQQGTSIYNSISSQPSSEAKYFGSTTPLYYGSLRNTFSYGPISFSANILFKLAYFFRRPMSELVQYNQLFSSGILQGGEYSKRWQTPGDEYTTNVPSIKYPATFARDAFYQFSEINVLKADHIRMQEINISYSLNKRNWIIKNPKLYMNISNLGIIWKANKDGLDPEVQDYPRPRIYSLGFNANF